MKLAPARGEEALIEAIDATLNGGKSANEAEGQGCGRSLFERVSAAPDRTSGRLW